VAPVLILMFINIHHYFTDGVIWKISNPEVRKELFAHVPRPAGGGGGGGTVTKPTAKAEPVSAPADAMRRKDRERRGERRSAPGDAGPDDDRPAGER
jgi:hypothetical protein